MPRSISSLNFDFLRDIAPVASINREPSVMQITPSLPVHSVPEFIAYAKANPGKINHASAGAGTAGHIAGEMFKMMTGISMVACALSRRRSGGHRSDRRSWCR